ncbi:MAG: SET domain-containing protein [Candidatus Woesearchaeota archaeon]
MEHNKYVEVKNSGIHRHGVFAKANIPAGTRIIEYKGRKIAKQESEKILSTMLEEYKKNPEHNAATYIFELNSEGDLDGDIPDNDAKYINHSCKPNCKYEYITKDGKIEIWIVTLKDILKGEEVTYNYGFSIQEEDLYDFEKHPCKCGSERCVGYIVAEEDWPRLKELIEKKTGI